VLDTYEDEITTEECEETVTTVCTQKSEVKSHTSQVKESKSSLKEEGKAKDVSQAKHDHPGHLHFLKREADPEPAHVHIGHVASTHGHENVHPAECKSTTDRKCKDVPNKAPRKQQREVCENVKDIITVEDCTQTVVTECEHSLAGTKILSHEVKKQ